LVLFVIVAVSRFGFWERTFWEWDEFLYATALHHFNVWEHYPPPPGSIGFVATTRAFNYFLHDDLKALVFTNVFFGSLLVFPLYFFYRRFSSARVALLAAALTLFNPIIWYFSETAFADITALFWLMTSLALLFHYENNRSFYLGMVCMGIAMSIRQQNVLFGILLVPLLLLLKLRRGELKPVLIGLGFLVVTCLAWFVPLAWSAGGLAQYMELLRIHGQATGKFDAGYINMRHIMSLYAFLSIKMRLIWGTRSFAILMVGLTALGTGVYLWRGQRKTFLLLLLTFLPWAVLDFLWMHVEYAKYNSSTIVLISFFIVYGLLELWPRSLAWGKFPATVLVLGLIVLSAWQTLPVVRYLHTIKSPVAQLADYIHQNLNPQRHAIVFDNRMKVVPPYYLSEFVTICDASLDESRIEEIQHMDWYYMGLPQTGFLPQVTFSVTDEQLRQFGGMFYDVWLTKTDILYSSEYGSTLMAGIAYHRLLESEAHCYLKNNGGAKILSMESKVVPSSPRAIPVHLEFDGHSLLDAQAQPAERFDHYILLKEPYEGTGPHSVLTIKTAPPKPGDALSLEAVYWWDIEPAEQPQTQVIDFKPEDQPALVGGWLPPEREGELTVAKSDGVGSVLAVTMKPRGIYELSFRVSAVAQTQEPGTAQGMSLCLGDTCSSWIRLAPGEWRTYTRLVLSPATPANENVELVFNYGLMSSASDALTDSEDTSALGVAFNYVKLTWLGNLPAESPW
jgi:hypothetical protein